MLSASAKSCIASAIDDSGKSVTRLRAGSKVHWLTNDLEKRGRNLQDEDAAEWEEVRGSRNCKKRIEAVGENDRRRTR